MSDVSVSDDVAVYLYKCLLRRRQSLTRLRPVDSDPASYDATIRMLEQVLPEKTIYTIQQQLYISNLKQITVYIDASVKDNDNPNVPSCASFSFVVMENDNIIYKEAECIGGSVSLKLNNVSVEFEITSNVAEYVALVKALEFIVNGDFKGSVTIYSDSQLVVNQVNFSSATRSPKLIVLRDYSRRLMSELRNVDLVHLPRENNTVADALARAAVPST